MIQTYQFYEYDEELQTWFVITTTYVFGIKYRTQSLELDYHPLSPELQKTHSDLEAD